MRSSLPHLPLRFLRWFCRRDLVKYIEGDLTELYNERFEKSGRTVATLRFYVDVLLLFRPSMIQSIDGVHQLNHFGMLKSYFRIGWRNMLRNKGYSFINIGGLAAGLAIVILIGLWMYDELSYNRYHKNYDRIGRVWVNQYFDGKISSQWAVPLPLGADLRKNFADFEQVAVTLWNYGHFIQWNDNKFSRNGMFVEPEFLKVTSLNMKQGTSDALTDPRSIVLSESLARVIFGKEDPMGQILKLDVNHVVTVTGIYEDIPRNNFFAGSEWLSNIDLYVTDYVLDPNARTNWGNFQYQAFVLLNDGVSFEESSARIKDVIRLRDPRSVGRTPELFLQPMSQWHLYGNYENGVNAGGDITFVWLFGTIGFFVLMLACINFMNLTTARSEGRAKEIGLRKTIGSYRGQLVVQFLAESILVVSISFAVAIVLVMLSLDGFNHWTGKQIVMPFAEPSFWITGVSFILVTGLIAGSYPAFLLSSFNTVSILKGTFRLGWFPGFSRKTLVVVQFVVSVTLVIGTVTVYQQIQYARNRPIGYDKDGLITTYGYPFYDNALNPNTYDGLRQQLLNTGAVVNMAKSSSPPTDLYSMQSDFNWEGRDPQTVPNIGVVWCSHDFGKTIGIRMLEGRDFSREFASDTASIILNEAAVDYMGMTDPVGKTVTYDMKPFTVIGVMKNVLMDSPYAPVGPVVHMIDYRRANIITMKLNPAQSASDNLALIEGVFRNFRPDVTFEAQFTDEQFALKFDNEKRIGGLAMAFTLFAILISCLGLFGLASFVAERRTREIGIRKVSGASVFDLWSMLSKDFVVLVVISCIVATPLAWYFMDGWLEQYSYRTPVSIWTFIGSGIGAVLLTLITVSYQALRAARANPINSLRSE